MYKLIAILMIISIPYFITAQSHKNDMTGKIGLSLYGGPNIPVNGTYSSDYKTTDLFNTGSQYGIGVSYFFTKGFGVEGTMYAGYNYLNSKYNTSGNDPVFVNLSTSLNVIYNFGHLFKKPVISPVIRIGAGSYQYEEMEDGIINGEVVGNKVNHKVKSFGLNFGAGAEYNASKKFTIGLMIDYNLSFPKEENGLSSSENNRTSYGYFIPQLKISYYFPTIK